MKKSHYVTSVLAFLLCSTFPIQANFSLLQTLLTLAVCFTKGDSITGTVERGVEGKKDPLVRKLSLNVEPEWIKKLPKDQAMEMQYLSKKEQFYAKNPQNSAVNEKYSNDNHGDHLTLKFSVLNTTVWEKKLDFDMDSILGDVIDHLTSSLH